MSAEASSGILQTSHDSEREKEHALVCAACPEHWIGFYGKCYYFSEDTANWTFSQTVCASLEARLAQFETLEQQERDKEHVFVFPVCAACPEYWIEFSGKCYYFSEKARNWTFSQAFCTSVEARLAQFETLKELDFLKRYAGPSDHWIGLSRESSIDNWEWTDGTDHSSWFIIKGAGDCAYLNDKCVSSARSDTKKKWICNTLLGDP